MATTGHVDRSTPTCSAIRSCVTKTRASATPLNRGSLAFPLPLLPSTAMRTTTSAIPRLASAPLRRGHLDEFVEPTYDLLIVGGGVTGAGLASAAARAGLKVALCEAQDFGAGTSSRSSKLIHGGLRYLETFEFRLVRQSALERKEIHGQAPHLAEPRWMVTPYSGWWQRWTLRLGIRFYEWLGRVNHADRQQHWTREIMDTRASGLCRAKYQEAIAYREYTTDDARLVVALARDSVRRGAKVMNYLSCQAVRIRDAEIIEVDLLDGVAEQALTVRAHCVVNAAGPWVDSVIAQGAGVQDPVMQLSRGSHIVVPASRLPIEDLLMLRARDDRRFFVMRRDDVVHIGTTDIPQKGEPEYWPTVTQEEIDYLLNAVSIHFPEAKLERNDIVGAWAGLRPLVRRGGQNSDDPGKVSRAEEVIDHGRGFITIAGGKLTGYPGMARQVLEKVAEKLRRNVYALTQPSPAPLPGGDFDGDAPKLAARLREEFPVLSKAQALRLVRYYGTECFPVLSYGLDPVPGCPEIFSSEIYWAFEVEGAVSLEDLVFRRLRVFYNFCIPRERLVSSLKALGHMSAKLQGWSEARLEIEVQVAMQALRSEMGELVLLPSVAVRPKEIPKTAPFANLGL